MTNVLKKNLPINVYFNSKVQICINSVIHFLYETWRGCEGEKDEKKQRRGKQGI